MTSENRYNLKRTIPETVKRKVRKNSGFGCVLCGAAICDYEHIEPEFKDAQSHNPKGITLLCAGCHDKKTRGIYSKEKILDAMKNPKCKEQGFTFDSLDIGKKNIAIQFGNCLFIDTLSLICVDSISLLTLIPPNPELHNEPYKLNAFLTDNDENGIFGITNNTWFGNIENWDIECIGRNIKIRKKLGDIVLHLENIPREKLIIHRLNMSFKGYQIIGDSNGIKVLTPSNKQILTLTEGAKITGKVALNITNELVLFHKLVFHGGNIDLRNTGTSNCTFVGGSITM